MLDKNEAQAIIKKICEMTKYYAKVSISSNGDATTRFANSEISQNISATDTSVSLTVYDGKKEASCSTNVLSGDGLEKLVRDAENILPFMPEGEFEAFPFRENASSLRSSGISTMFRMNEPPSATLNDAEVLAEAFGVMERAELIKEGVARLAPGSTAAGALALSKEAVAIGDGNGFFRYARTDFLSFNTVVSYASGASGAGQLCSHTFDGADMKRDILREFDKAAATAKAAQNPVSADLGAYTVVMSPLAFGDLIYYAAEMHNAKTMEDGISYTIGNMGKKIFGENITIRDDVNYPGTRKLFFDAEGNARKPVTLVDKGVVAALLYDNKTAARNNAAVTGHAFNNKGMGGIPCNLIVEGGEASLEEMIAGVKKGIFINEFHYTNTISYRNLQITGLTRNGTFLIENGKLGRALTTMRFTQNLCEMLNSVTALSKNLEKVPDDRQVFMMPAATVENFHFTGKQ